MTKYIMRVLFVDNTYCDEGNRYTTRELTYYSIDDLADAYEEIVRTRKLWARSTVTKEAKYFDVEPAHVTIAKIIEINLDAEELTYLQNSLSSAV